MGGGWDWQPLMCTQETLVGYLLDALEEHERAEVERHLADSPTLRAQLNELRRALHPLNHDAAPLDRRKAWL